MKKVTIFGKPGGGKSTLGRKLSAKFSIKQYPLDLIEYKQNGERISREEYSKAHSKLLAQNDWIIDGLGTLESFWERIDSADTVIYIDLPYKTHYWWIVKRFMKSLLVKPEGWPEGSSVLKGTIASWKYLGMSRQFWTDELCKKIMERSREKVFIRITSVKQLNRFFSYFPMNSD
ncbi:adenylate kinase [Aliikangiella sp. IMCC44359]|uniref:adenylate kinase n=1 Tax=Aliikangiella sp. IMCC44359 TaxID=3459125 RepID=UPI00403AF581